MNDRTAAGSTRAWRERRAEWGARLPLPCSVCGLPVKPDQAWHLDHVTPRRQGGTDVWPAHKACNLQKGGRVLPTRAYVDPALASW